MKLSNLQFKIAGLTENRCVAIQKAIFERGGTWKESGSSTISRNGFVSMLWNGVHLTWGGLSEFEESDLPEMTLAQVLSEIEKCEPQNPYSEWFEIEINDRQQIVYDARNTLLLEHPWWDWQIFLKNIECIEKEIWQFGGWLWEDSCSKNPVWAANLGGIDKNGTLVFFADTWVKPIIPLKVRFWRPKR